MRYTDSFCGLYSLETGTKLIAWFYIILYLPNCFVNIFILDMVKSYKERVDMHIIYDHDQLQAFHYICLVFGIITIGLAALLLLKLSQQSELLLNFVIKWNIFRCLFVFSCIIYVCFAVHHILTVFLSCFVFTIDLCASAYFTGIVASYLKELEDGDNLKSDNGKVPGVQLISHVKKIEKNQISSRNVAIDMSSSKANVMEVGIPNKGTDERVDEQEKNDKTLSQEPSTTQTNKGQLKTVEVVMETKHHDVSSESETSPSQLNDNVPETSPPPEEINESEIIFKKSDEEHVKSNENKEECPTGQDIPCLDLPVNATSTVPSCEVITHLGVSNFGFENTESNAGKVDANLPVGGEDEGEPEEEAVSAEIKGDKKEQTERNGTEKELEGGEIEKQEDVAEDKMESDEEISESKRENRDLEEDGKGLDKDEKGSETEMEKERINDNRPELPGVTIVPASSEIAGLDNI